MKKILIRVSTVAISLDILIKGQLDYLNEYYDVIAISSPGKSLETVEKREGVKVITVPMERKISIFKDIISLIRLIKVFRKTQPLIVHSITPKAGLLSMVAAKIANVPIRIHTFTGLIFPTSVGVKKRILILMDKLLSYCSTEIIPEGQGVKNDLINHHITKKNINVIANGNVNGIDVNYFSENSIRVDIEKKRLELGISKDDFVFIYIGRIVKDKGFYELIHAFKQIENTKKKLIILGNTEEEMNPQIKELFEFINGSPLIKFMGFQQEIREYLLISNVLVLPSYREGFPNVVLQAGAMGLPCIVTDINGSNEIIKDGVNGLIVPPKDIPSLHLAMDRMINNDILYFNAKKNCRPMIVERFEQSIVWESILSKYKELERNVQKLPKTFH